MMSRRCFDPVRQRLLLGVLVCLLTSAVLGEEKKPPKVTFDDDVKPILRQKCIACHNTDKKSADLDLSNYTSLIQGGASGTVIEAGDAESSYLYLLISHDSEPYMPPESPKIPDEMIETVRKWIDGGALQNAGSKATMKSKPKFDLALETAPTERPAVAPMPPHLPLEPIVYSPRETAATALATSPWSPLVAVAGQEQVLLYNTQTLDLVGVLPFPEGIAQILKFSRNGSLLLAGGGVGGASGKVVVWNVTTGERIFEIGDELDEVLAADISSDQTLVALGGPQRVVRIFSTSTGQKIHELRKHTDWIYSLEFSPDSVLLATGDRNGGLHVWEGWTGREYLTLGGHANGVTDVSWRPDSNVLASCGGDGNVRLWEMENGNQVKNWGAHGGGVTSIEYTRDARLITTGRDRVAKLWAVDGKQIRAFPAFADLALESAFCNETNRVIAADWTGAIRVWDSTDGKQLGQLTANPIPLAARLQAATEQLAAAQADHQAKTAAVAASKAAGDQVPADKLAAETKAAEEAAAAVSAAQAAVDHWKQEIEFAKQFQTASN